MPPLEASVMTFIKPEQYREVGSECQVECAKAFSNHVALIVPTKTCSKTIVLVKSTTAFKLEHLKEQAQKLATRIFFLPGCSIQSSKCLLEVPSSENVRSIMNLNPGNVFFFYLLCIEPEIYIIFRKLKSYVLNLLKKWNKKRSLTFFFPLCLNPPPTPLHAKHSSCLVSNKIYLNDLSIQS